MATISTLGYGNIISIDTNSPLYNTNNITVLLSTLPRPSQYTIQDIGGNPFFFDGKTFSFYITTCQGTTFMDGTSTKQITVPYGKITCIQVSPTLWDVVDTQIITETSQPILSSLTINGNATILSTLYTSTLSTKSIYSYGTINASTITNNGILYASISTISTAIYTLETTPTYNYISLSTMSSIISTASNAPYLYITSTMVANSSLLLSTTAYNYITVASLSTAIAYLSIDPGCLSSISYAYLNGCTATNYMYYTTPSVSTTTCVVDIPNGVRVSMSNDPGGVTNNVWYTNVLSTNYMYGNAYGIEGTVSDIRLKSDIRTLVSSLELLNSLQGVSYRMKGNDKNFVGFIAQDVEKVFPEIVTHGMNEMKGIRYNEFIAPILEGIKELDAHVSELESLLCGNDII